MHNSESAAIGRDFEEVTAAGAEGVADLRTLGGAVGEVAAVESGAVEVAVWGLEERQGHGAARRIGSAVGREGVDRRGNAAAGDDAENLRALGWDFGGAEIGPLKDAVVVGIGGLDEVGEGDGDGPDRRLRDCTGCCGCQEHAGQ